jgi:hypothetical protein
VKRILFVVASTLMLLSALSTPPTVKADGEPKSPDCPPNQMCKP